MGGRSFLKGKLISNRQRGKAGSETALPFSFISPENYSRKLIHILRDFWVFLCSVCGLASSGVKNFPCVLCGNIPLFLKLA
jgi:hypothetical protein